MIMNTVHVHIQFGQENKQNLQILNTKNKCQKENLKKKNCFEHL